MEVFKDYRNKIGNYVLTNRPPLGFGQFSKVLLGFNIKT
jgi:hypothetical protein